MFPVRSCIVKGWIALVGLVLMIVALVRDRAYAKRRRHQLAAWASRRGLRFRPDRTYEMDRRFPALSRLQSGENRHASNRIEGQWRGRPFLGFDYHYQIRSIGPKGGSYTKDCAFSAVVIESSHPLKPILIRPERLIDRASVFLGVEDIKFESAAFNRRFFVKSSDRKWAYDLLHPRAMEHLLDAPLFALELDTGHVMAWREAFFAPRDFEQAAAVVTGLLDQLPAYVQEEMRESR